MNSSEPTCLYQLGRRNTLRILRLVSIGAYLEWPGEDGILLPKAYLPAGVEIGDELEVFVYHDNEGRLIATTRTPLIEVGGCALLKCLSVSDIGAFVEWGIHKDLLVPFGEQRQRLEIGKYYMIYAYIDHASGRIVGSAKLSKHIGLKLPSYRPGDKVSGIVAEMNEIGYRIIVESMYWGMIYFSDLEGAMPQRTSRPRIGGRKDGLNLRLIDEGGFSAGPEVFAQARRLERGKTIEAYVVRLREDGRLDLSLRPVGYGRIGAEAKRLLELLEQHHGLLPIGDKSSPEEVERLTGMSKKTFKMALGALFKAGRIRLSPTSTHLIEP